MPLSLSHTILLLSLYFSQGVPAGFIVHVLPPLMREQGASYEIIGLFKLLALPWVLKVLWAPWIDQHNPPWSRSGAHRRQSWIVGTQGGVIVLMAVMAGFSGVPTQTLGVVLLCVLLLALNTAAATQDIATDGLAVRLLSATQRGWGNALQVGGYKLGMIVCSSALLFSIPLAGWQASLMVVAVLLFVCLMPVIRARQADSQNGTCQSDAVSSPASLRNHLDFLSQPALRAWLVVLCVFKLPDGLGSAMVKPLMVDRGLTLDEIALLTLVVSSVGLVAVFLGGLLLDRWGGRRSLPLLALAQALAMLAYVPVTAGWGGDALLWGVCLFEQVVDSISTVALFALMMHVCRPGHEGADFTLQACLQGVIAGMAGSLSGLLAGAFGLGALFSLAGGAGLLVWVGILFVHPSRLTQGASPQHT